jgi:hypothetical protein
LPGWKVGDPVFSHRAGVAVDQVLFSHKHSRILVCSSVSLRLLPRMIRKD